MDDPARVAGVKRAGVGDWEEGKKKGGGGLWREGKKLPSPSPPLFVPATQAVPTIVFHVIRTLVS